MLKNILLIVVAYFTIACSSVQYEEAHICEILENIYEIKATSLSLDNRKLSTLPDCIGNLKNLEYLYLGYNQLTELPESIGELTKLNYLYLFENQLTSLPESIGQLTELNKLDIGSNQLSRISDCIGNFTFNYEQSDKNNAEI